MNFHNSTGKIGLLILVLLGLMNMAISLKCWECKDCTTQTYKTTGNVITCPEGNSVSNRSPYPFPDLNTTESEHEEKNSTAKEDPDHITTGPQSSIPTEPPETTTTLEPSSEGPPTSPTLHPHPPVPGSKKNSTQSEAYCYNEFDNKHQTWNAGCTYSKQVDAWLAVTSYKNISTVYFHGPKSKECIQEQFYKYIKLHARPTIHIHQENYTGTALAEKYICYCHKAEICNGGNMEKYSFVLTIMPAFVLLIKTALF